MGLITHLHMLNVIYTRFIEMPNNVVRQADYRVLHQFGHLHQSIQLCYVVNVGMSTNLSKSFRLGMLLKAKSWKVNASSENFGLGQNADAAHAIDFHFHVRIAVRIT